jgi:hypothetical protein
MNLVFVDAAKVPGQIGRRQRPGKISAKSSVKNLSGI